MAEVVFGDLWVPVDVDGDIETVQADGSPHKIVLTGKWAVKKIRQFRSETKTVSAFDAIWTPGGTAAKMDGKVRTEMTLELIDQEPDAVERQRQWAMRNAPPDLEVVMGALFDLDTRLPDGKAAVVDVHEPNEIGSRFTVRVLDEEDL